MSRRRHCTFVVGGLLLGVDVDRLQEVIGEHEITPVPLADPVVVGLLNLRGQILTVIDARTRLGLAARPAGSSYANAIIQVEDEALSFVVDRAGDVVEIDDHEIEKVPATVDATISEYMTGACQLDTALMLLLDADLALSVAER